MITGNITVYITNPNRPPTQVFRVRWEDCDLSCPEDCLDLIEGMRRAVREHIANPTFASSSPTQRR